MSRIPVPTHSPSHTRAYQEPVSFPAERAVSPLPSSRLNSTYSAPMSSLSGHASSAGGKKLSKRALGDEVSIRAVFLPVMYRSQLGQEIRVRLAVPCQKFDRAWCMHFAYRLTCVSANRLCARGLRMNSLASAPSQPPSKATVDAEANLT